MARGGGGGVSVQDCEGGSASYHCGCIPRSAEDDKRNPSCPSDDVMESEVEWYVRLVKQQSSSKHGNLSQKTSHSDEVHDEQRNCACCGLHTDSVKKPRGANVGNALADSPIGGRKSIPSHATGARQGTLAVLSQLASVMECASTDLSSGDPMYSRTPGEE